VRRRKTAVVRAFLDGVLPQLWVSDLWKPPLKAGAGRYQIGLAHPRPALAAAVQAETGERRAAARAWAEAMATLLPQAIDTRNEHAVGRLDAVTAAATVTTIELDGDRLLAAPLTAGGSDALQTRFPLHRRGRLTFLHDRDIPPTHHASERSVRPSVVDRKVTGGFRSEAFAQGDAALRPVADTARKRGEDVFTTRLTAAGSPLPISSHYRLALP